MACLLVLEKGNISEEEVNTCLLIYMIVTQQHFASLKQIKGQYLYTCTKLCFGTKVSNKLYAFI